MTRVLAPIGVLLFFLWIAFVGYINNAMHKPPEQFGQVMMHMPMPAYFLFPFETMWTRARAGQLHPGSQAPDFTVETLDKTQHLQLASLWQEKPVVLVFGSYTWPPFRREVPALNKLYEQYGEKIDFYAVYILEAHPSDVWQMQSNVKDAVVFASPKNEDERAQIAGTCVRKLGIKFPALLDGFDNRIESAYTGWPDRLYLINAGGRVLYKSKPGPFGFKPAELEKAIKSALSGKQMLTQRWEEANTEVSVVGNFSRLHVWQRPNFDGDKAAQFAAFESVKDEFMKAPHPAWTAVGVTALIPDNGVVEIQMIAQAPKK